MDYNKIGNLITTMRKERNMTQKELAHKLMITDRAVSKWERGLGCPDISLLENLSKIFDISILELLKGEKDNDNLSKNEVSIESIKFYKNNLKYKIKNYLNIVIITTIIMFIIVQIFLNLKMTYHLNEKFDSNFYSTINQNEQLKNKINLIKNNQGIYSNSEYEIILTYLTEVSSNIEKLNILRNISNYSEFIDSFNKIDQFGTKENVELQMFSIMGKQIDVVSQVSIFQDLKVRSRYQLSFLYNHIKNPFNYNSYIVLLDSYFNYLYLNTRSYDILLDTIIEGGNIN